MTHPLRAVPTPHDEDPRDRVITELAAVVPKYQQLCGRKGGCRTINLPLFAPLMAAWHAYGPLWVVAADDPWDHVMVELAVFARKYQEHTRCGWVENGRTSIAAAAFAPVANTFRGARP